MSAPCAPCNSLATHPAHPHNHGIPHRALTYADFTGCWATGAGCWPNSWKATLLLTVLLILRPSPASTSTSSITSAAVLLRLRLRRSWWFNRRPGVAINTSTPAFKISVCTRRPHRHTGGNCGGHFCLMLNILTIAHSVCCTKRVIALSRSAPLLIDLSTLGGAGCASGVLSRCTQRGALTCVRYVLLRRSSSCCPPVMTAERTRRPALLRARTTRCTCCASSANSKA